MGIGSMVTLSDPFGARVPVSPFHCKKQLTQTKLTYLDTQRTKNKLDPRSVSPGTVIVERRDVAPVHAAFWRARRSVDPGTGREALFVHNHQLGDFGVGRYQP